MSQLKNKVFGKLSGKKHQILDDAQNYPCLYLSQMKSGTTYICNFFVVYNQLNYGLLNGDLSNAHKYGVFRSDKPLSTDELTLNFNYFLENIRKYEINFVQAHYLRSLNQAREHLPCSTRRIYDYANSSYDFHFVKRNKFDKSLDRALREIIENYIIAHGQQKIAIQKSRSYCVIKYEDLIADPKITFNKITAFLSEGNINLDLVDKCIAMVSKSKIEAFVAKVGAAFNMEKSADYKANSLFRNNDEKYFSKELIDSVLIKNDNLKTIDGYLSYD